MEPSKEHVSFLLKQCHWSRSSLLACRALTDSTACTIAKGVEKCKGEKLTWRLMCRVPVEKVTAGELMKSRHRALEAAQPRHSAQSRVFSGIQ